MNLELKRDEPEVMHTEERYDFSSETKKADKKAFLVKFCFVTRVNVLLSIYTQMSRMPASSPS